MRGVAPEKSLQFSAFTHTYKARIEEEEEVVELSKGFFLFFSLCSPTWRSFLGSTNRMECFSLSKNKIAGYIFFRLGYGKRFTHIVDIQCGGSTTSSSIYHTEGHAERNEDVSTFFSLRLLHFMEGGSIRPALRRTRPEQKPTTPVFFPFWLLLLTIFISLSPLKKRIFFYGFAPPKEHIQTDY